MTNMMIVVIKTLMELLTYIKISVVSLLWPGQRFIISSTVLILMIVARCPDKLMCLSYCDVITIIYTVSLAPTITWS